MVSLLIRAYLSTTPTHQGWCCLSLLVQAGDEVFELVPEASADCLAATADLSGGNSAGNLLHEALPTALHHLHQICTPAVAA